MHLGEEQSHACAQIRYPVAVGVGDTCDQTMQAQSAQQEYHHLRAIAIRTVRHLGVFGECNIQYALDPLSSEYRVIEINARLSRSSALASKATGYPLAYVAAKPALGYALPDIPNGITRCTRAFFEPALDYLVCKVPRWDLDKFRGASMVLGSEMKSVGEVMAIGRTFPEVIQKALRMLDIGVKGLDAEAFQFEDIRAALHRATPLRAFAVARALHEGMSVDEVKSLTRIDRWFLERMSEVVCMHQQLSAASWPLDADLLTAGPTYAGIYQGTWVHPASSALPQETEWETTG